MVAVLSRGPAFHGKDGTSCRSSGVADVQTMSCKSRAAVVAETSPGVAGIAQSMSGGNAMNYKVRFRECEL